MKIMKFGGAVLQDRTGFEQMGNILRDEKEKPLLIIISAFSKATRDLKNAGLMAESGDVAGAKLRLNDIINQHIEYAKELITDEATLSKLIEIYKAGESRISVLLRSIAIIKELTPRTLDALMSYGEYFALQTVNQYLIEKGFKVNCIDSTSIIVSDSNFSNANPLMAETVANVNEILRPALIESNIVLTQGFVAKDTNGDITTMGIESSNLTATILTELLGEKELIIWTDVEGIRSADPKIINRTLPIETLSYNEALMLGNSGLKLIYPPMIDRAEKNKIKLIFRSAFEPNGDSTIISSIEDGNNTPVHILMENLTYYSVKFKSHYSRMNNLPILLNDLNDSHSIVYIGLASNSIKFLLKNGKKLQKLSLPDCDVKVIKNCSMLTIINLPDYYSGSRLNIDKIEFGINHSDYEIYHEDLDNQDDTRILTLILPDKKGHDFLKKIHEWQIE
jgi:aspartate kinase